MKTLDFGKQIQYGTGLDPAIAVNNKDEFVEIHWQMMANVPGLYYGTGKIKTSAQQTD